MSLRMTFYPKTAAAVGLRAGWEAEEPIVASPDPSQRTRPKVLAAVGLLVPAALALVVASGCANPAATGPAVPPTPVSLDLPAALTMAKSVCEGQARSARMAARSRPIPPDEVSSGEKLYAETKAALDDLITLLRTSLDRHHIREDGPEIDAKLTAAAEKMAAFMEWNDRVKVPRYFEATQLSEARKGLDGWLASVSQDPEAAKSVRTSTLEGARLLAWEALGD